MGTQPADFETFRRDDCLGEREYQRIFSVHEGDKVNLISIENGFFVSRITSKHHQ
jgi:hypothetical protein